MPFIYSSTNVKNIQFNKNIFRKQQITKQITFSSEVNAFKIIALTYTKVFPNFIKKIDFKIHSYQNISTIYKMLEKIIFLLPYP